MKLSGIEKGMLIAMAVCVLILCITIPQCVKSVHQAEKQIQKEGLKSSFEKIWYGEKGAPAGNDR